MFANLEIGAPRQPLAAVLYEDSARRMARICGSVAQARQTVQRIPLPRPFTILYRTASILGGLINEYKPAA
jgi:hypothetical protein